MTQFSFTPPFLKVSLAVVVLCGLYLASFQNYLLFHTLVEMFSIVVAFGIFTIGWNSKNYIKSNYLLFLAIAYLFIAFLDLMHTLSYKGMGIFTDYDFYANQLWIATRYLESLSLLAAFYFMQEQRVVVPVRVFICYFVITALIVASIFWWKVFPVCFIEGQGLTPFKKISEYIISLILVTAIWFLVKMRSRFDRDVHRWLVYSLVFTILSELAFTFYISNYGLSNLIGHYFKLFSFYFVYRALVVTGIIDPHAVLFRALQDSETKFRALVESSTDFIWAVDAQARYTYVSPLAAEIFGYSQDEMLGRQPFDFMPADTGAIARARFQEMIRNGDSIHNVENHYLDSKGKILILETNGVPIFDDTDQAVGYRGVDRNVTERKRDERELRKLMGVVESSPICMVITSPDGIIEYGNPAFCERNEKTAEEVVGRDVSLFVSSVHEDALHVQVLKAMREGHMWQRDICDRNPKGEMVWEHVIIAPVMDDGGDVINYVAIIEDISDRKDLERLKDDVEQIMRHDLKSPLSGIIGIPDLLLAETNLTDDQRYLVSLVQSAGRRILRMVDHSLDLFKMETGVYHYSPVAVDVLDVLNSVVSDHSKLANSKNVNMTVSVDGATCESECLIQSDKDLLYPMLSNFIINALEASPQGGEVETRVEGVPCRAISISNHGAVPKEIKGHFFEKYKTYGKKRGTGLGAYSSKLIADAMGCLLALETSDDDDTTRISIVFPDTQNPAEG